MLVFGAEAVLQLQVTLTDIITSTARVQKHELKTCEKVLYKSASMKVHV